ncbi:MAG: ABC transporter ATP-binding protein [Hyphomicrobiales bacterium]|nr:ABC transporter ATP-binding protein [Hyphomicrobiales bacterium]
MTAVLATKSLVRRFGGLTATNNVTFSLPVGARHALIGPNGAGKTTFVNLLSGVLAPTSGRVILDGKDVTAWPAENRARAGLSRTFQINQLFADFTPLETIGLALSEAHGEGAEFWRRVGTHRDVVDEAVSILERLDLGDVMEDRVGSLPYGKQRLLEIAIAVAPKPKVLLLDEPAAGVPEGEREQILDIIAALPEEMALVLIEHDMELVFRFARTISVLVGGALFVEGSASEVARDPRVRQVYLGETEIDHHFDKPGGAS